MSRIPQSGGLLELSLPRLLLELQNDAFQGAVALTRERTEKRILLQEGRPVFAESNVPSESLGLQLLDQGTLSRESYGAVVQRVQERGCKEGVALLELRLLGPKELFQALKEQMRRRILECFGWPDGRFELLPGEALRDDAQAFRTDPLALVREGLERHWGPDRILGQLGDKLARVAVPSRRLARVRKRLGEDADLDRVLDALDGGETTLGAALQSASSPRVLASLWVLDASRALDYPEPVRREPPKTAGDEADVEIVFGGTDTGADPDPAASRPTADADPERSTAVESLRQEVLERHGRLGELDHYGVLGVARDADAAAVKRAYFAAAKRYHPDALASLGLEAVRSEANALFARVAKAYATLSDPQRRRDYDAELEGAVATDANRLANAESLYRKGEILLRRGDFAGALQFLKPAIDLWPEDAAYQSAVGWALFKSSPADTEQAQAHLEQAVALDGANATALFRLGAVQKSLGDKAGGERLQARARKLDSKVDGR